MTTKYITLRMGKGLSFLADKKAIVVTTCLFLLACFVMVLSTGMGEIKISPLEVIYSILGKGTEEHALVVQTLRLPRVLTAFLAGACLAVAGAILQGMIRNPLASPDIIGITGGAAVGAVGFMIYLSGSLSIHWLPLAAMTGAGVISFLIYLLSWNKGVTPVRLVLIGIGVATAMGAITKMMLLSASIYSASQAYVWLTGSVYGSTWDHVRLMIPWTVIFLPLAYIYARKINIQALGDEIATSVGSTVQRERFILLAISVILAGAAVSVAGAIGFVGLIAPHLSRKLVGPSFGNLLPVSLLLGGVIVVVADLIGRTAFSPSDIPAGVFTSGIGAPFFIYLLFRNRNRYL